MCGRYALKKLEDVRERFRLDISRMELLGSLFNIAPTDIAPIVIEENEKRVAIPAAFGLIPEWSKTGKLDWATINAKSETIEKLPAFKRSFTQRRCLVPASGYFEWATVGKEKLPTMYSRSDGELFAFAGIWDAWKAPDGTEKFSFSIATTTPNSLAAELHDRMPVLLLPEDEPLWLSHHVDGDDKTLKNLLRPFPAELMKAVRVGKAVNSSRNKSAECVMPLT